MANSETPTNKGTAMYTVAQINAMTEDEKANLHRMIARKFVIRTAGFIFLKIATVNVMRTIARHSYQASTLEH